MKTLLCGASALSLLIGGPVMAATMEVSANAAGAANAENANSNDIVVTATSVATIDNRAILETPRTVQAISGKLFETTSPSTLQDIVRNFAGITQGRGAQSQITQFSSRGVGTDVRRDGLPLLRIAGPVEDIEQIEFLQGVGDATQAGEKTPGGILNFVSKKPSADSFTRLNFAVSEYGNVLGQADINMPLNESTGIRANIGLERVRFSNSMHGSRQSIILAGRHEFAPGLILDISGFYTSTPQREQFNGYFPIEASTGEPLRVSYDKRYGQKWARNNFRTGLVQANLGGDLGDGWSLTLGGNYWRVWERATDATFAFGTFPDAAGNVSIGANHLDQDISGGGARGSLAKDIAFGDNVRNKAALIADYTAYRLGSFIERFTIPGANIYGSIDVPRPNFVGGRVNLENTAETYGFAFQDELTLFDRLTLTAGVKRYTSTAKGYDSSPQENVVGVSKVTHWLPNYSALLKVTPNISVYASRFEAIEPGPVPNSGYINFGEQLPPLRSRTTELGAKYQKGALVASLSYFKFKRPSQLDAPAVDSNGNPGFRLTLSGATRYSGLDFSLSGRITSQLTVIASGSYVDAKILRSDDPTVIGKSPTGVPKYGASVYSEYEVIPSWFVQGAVKYSGKMYSFNDNTAQVPGYTIFDIGARHEDKISNTPIHVGVFVQNLANKFYYVGTSYQTTQIGNSRAIKLTFGADF